MTEPRKSDPLSETAIAQKVVAMMAKQPRKTTAQKAVAVSVDFTALYPKTSVLIGCVAIAASLWKLEGIPLYIGCGVGVCFVPGLTRKIVDLASGLRKAKGPSHGSDE